jgi:hypothetical protein
VQAVTARRGATCLQSARRREAVNDGHRRCASRPRFRGGRGGLRRILPGNGENPDKSSFFPRISKRSADITIAGTATES